MIFFVCDFGVKGVSDIYKLEVFNIYESVMKQELFGNEMEKIGNL